MRVAPPSPTSSTDRDQLRRQMRGLRRALCAADRAAASDQFARIARRALLLRPGMRVAVYLAHNHEADLSALIELARRRGCSIHLPAISDYRRSRMEFVQYRPGSELRANRYGIPEPDLRTAARVPVRDLDLILLPLVAVDPHGCRLGSGAGFYDRRLHHLRPGRRWRRPKLIGVGYEFQRVLRLDPRSWDVPLDAVITEKNLHWSRPACAVTASC